MNRGSKRDNAIIVDVEATTAIRQVETLAARRMIEGSLERFELYPERLIGDTAYGSAEMLVKRAGFCRTGAARRFHVFLDGCDISAFGR